MAAPDANEIEQIIERFRQGQLTEHSLRQALERPAAEPKRQDLLYLQASSTALTAEILGLSLVRHGELVGGAGGPGDWPYASVLEALRDGWRIIKFPELALLLVQDRTLGLGCEFILEQWS
jgi:hypothetical protein